MSLRRSTSALRQALFEYSLQKNKLYDVDNNSKDAKEMAGQLSNMLGISYAAIGGFAGGGDLGEFSGFFVADVDDDPDIDIGLYYKKKAGTKIAALASDGTSVGKKSVVEFLVKVLEKPGTWVEVSDAVANILLKKRGLKSFDDHKAIEKAVGKGAITWHGKHPEGLEYGTGWYTRAISGHDHTKIVVGRPA